MRRKLASLVTIGAVAILMPGLRLAGQDVQVYPDVINETKHDTSPPMKAIGRAGETGPKHTIHFFKVPHKISQGQTDPVVQSSAGPLIGTTAGLNLLGVGVGFSGPQGAFSPNAAPPDTNGAAGATQVVEWVNESYAVFDKSTGSVVQGPIAGNSLWTGFGGPCETTNDGDIIAQYDKAASRWVMAQPVFSAAYTYCIAVSTSSDATGTFNRYSFSMPNFPDYPKLGVWPDAYYASFNLFNGNSFLGGYVCAFDRNAMLNGTAATAQCFNTGTGFPSLLPSDLDGSTPPPAGSPGYFMDFGFNALNLWKLHVDFSNPANTTFTGPIGVSNVAAFNEACGGGTCIPQKGTSQQLDSLGDRLMYRLAYRNFGDHESVVVGHSVNTSNAVGVRWYEVRSPGSNPTVYQQGTYAPDSSYRWMPSIAMDKAGDIAVGYSVSSSGMFPAIRYTGRVPGDPLGTLQAENSIVEGGGSQNGGLNRWGDYSSMAIDPVDDCTFWYSNEYEQLSGSFNWSTRVASFKFPSCGGPPTPDFTISASPSSQTVVAGNPTSYTVTISPLNSYTGTVNLTNSSPGSGIVASLSPTSVTNGSGTSTLSVTTSGTTPSGNYTITVTGTDGSLVHSTSVTLVVNAPPPPPDFSLSASPTSQTVLEGSSPTYTITVSPVNGFTGTVSLTNNSPGSGITASLSPASVGGGSGNSTLTVSTSGTTPAGSYSVTVTGTSGSLTHQVTVTVVVTGDFSITPTSGTLTVHRGSSGTDTVSIAALDGFTGTVSLSVTGQPNRVNASLSPSSVAGHGSSTLTVNVNRKAAVGKYTLTIKGTSGGLSHSVTVTLTVT